MEENLAVLGRSNAVWMLVIGAVLATTVLLYGEHVEAQFAQLADGNQFAPVLEVYRAAFHERYGKAALGIIGSSLIAAWRLFKRDRRRMLGY